MSSPEHYMDRCLQLASLGREAAPNPMVGAVLVHNNRIIGEGYHKVFGEPHAEVNCIASVSKEDRHLIKESVLYVSLEPCAHRGKTPACTKLILDNDIEKVVVGCRDPFGKVNGKGIELLKQAGVEVVQNVRQKECEEMNRRFFCFHRHKRPYIVLKWAQSADWKVARKNFSRVFISNDISNRMVHKWRTEEMAILVGTNTALFDNPQLTARLWKGRQPLRAVVDLNLRLPAFLHLFDGQLPTVVFNAYKTENHNNLQYIRIEKDQPLISQLLHAFYTMNIFSVLVEGGPQLLQSFIDASLWDEARVITNPGLSIAGGIQAPVMNGELVETNFLGSDQLHIYKP